MEVRSWPVRLWGRFALVVGDLFDELLFRAVLAFKVLIGHVPLRTERRTWNRVVEAPVLVD